jgi:hypothetical protein
MIPYAVTNFQKLVTTTVGVMNAIPFAAKLDPPKVVTFIVIFIG